MAEAVERRNTVCLRVKGERGTEAVARRLAACVRRGDVIGLRGPLGSGKTVFARAFIRALTRPDEEVPSPSYTLVQRYDSADRRVGAIFHFDLYRLEAPDEIWELGIEEAVTGGVVLVEWPERLGTLRPADFLEIALAPVDDASEAAREICIRGYGALRDRVAFLEMDENG
jgi:tRNA threonylcarbamoyladenosine biosynthesis protein TsaE